jgi:hypothetical protein
MCPIRDVARYAVHLTSALTAGIACGKRQAGRLDGRRDLGKVERPEER